MNTLHLILIFLASAIAILPIFHYLRINPIIGYMLAGILLGEHGFGVVEDTHSIALFSELGVIFLLFAIGLDFTFDRLRKLGSTALLLGALQIVVCTGIFTVIARFFGISLEASIILSSGLALSSTALCLRLLTDRKEHASSFGQLSISILLIQDLAVVPIMTLAPLFSEPDVPIFSTLLISIVKGFLAVIAIIFLGRFVMRQIFRVVSQTRNAELFTATTLFVLLGCSYITSLAGLSMALGAFLAGLLLTETEYQHQVESDMHPFRGILLGLFFATVGMTMNPLYIANHFAEVGAVLVGLIAIKTAVVGFLCLLFSVTKNHALKTGVLLSQGGEFAFIVIGLAIKEQLLDQDTSQLLVGAIALSMMSTPFLVSLGGRVIDRFFPSEASVSLFPELTEIKDHVIIIGFGRVAQNIARILEMQNFPYLAIDKNEHIVTLARKSKKPVFFTDAIHLGLLNALGAKHACVVVVATDDPQASITVAEQMRTHFKDVDLVVRAHNEEQCQQLQKIGVRHIVLETLETSVQLSALTLEKSGLSGAEIGIVIEQFRNERFDSSSA